VSDADLTAQEHTLVESAALGSLDERPAGIHQALAACLDTHRAS